MLCTSKRRLACGVVRTFSTTSSKNGNHYDALGLTPKATQGDIKSAYYKLSMKYHPDKSKDQQSATKFRAIKEAYEVLGNMRLKKMYDKGLMVGKENHSRMDYKPEPEPTDPMLKFYKSQENPNVAPTVDGRTTIYDFDQWSKSHYGNLFKKTKYEREFSSTRQQKRRAVALAERQESIVYLVFAMVGLFMIMVFSGQTDYDRDVTAKEANKEKRDSK